MRLAPILMCCVMALPGPAMADTITIVVRVEVPLVCQSAAHRQAACNFRGMPPVRDIWLTSADGPVLVRSIAP